MSTDVISLVRMSDVHRIPDLDKLSCVRRALFGPVDHEENRKFVECELAKIEEEQCREWNFDFKREVPLQGRYRWSRVGNVQVTLRLPLANVCRKTESVTTSSVQDSASRKHRGQTKITDFMKNKKPTGKPYAKRTSLPNSPKHNVRRTTSS